MLRQFSFVLALSSFGLCAASTADEPASSTAPATARVTLHVEGMFCATCPITVRTVLEKLDGVVHATVSRKDKLAVVDYDPQRVTPKQMIKAIKDAGYDASE